MTEFATQDFGEIVQGRLQHPSGKPEFSVITALGVSCQLMGIRYGGRQGTPLVDFAEVVGFVE